MNTYRYVATVQEDIDNNKFISDCMSIRYEDGTESIGSTFCDHCTEIYYTTCAGCECEDNPDCSECALYKRIQRELKKVMGE